MTKARLDGPSAGAKLRVLKRDRFTCTYCGRPGTEAELEVDHIIAVANGGSHHISNLTTACRACNQSKGTKPMRPGQPGSRSDARHALTGMYFHTFTESGRIEYQAQVVAVDGETVLAQMYSWLFGERTEIRPFEKSFIYSGRCKLYADAEVWRFAAEQAQKRYRDEDDKA
jgi:hypothetical protein